MDGLGTWILWAIYCINKKPTVAISATAIPLEVLNISVTYLHYHLPWRWMCFRLKVALPAGLIGWLVGWLIGWLVGWLVGWVVGYEKLNVEPSVELAHLFYCMLDTAQGPWCWASA